MHRAHRPLAGNIDAVFLQPPEYILSVHALGLRLVRLGSSSSLLE